MNRYYLRGSRTGRYFVKGSGFSATRKQDASQLTAAEVQAAQILGFEPSVTEQVVRNVSFAVNYVRAEDIASNGGIRQNGNNPSSRRFRTFEEAFQHGTKLLTRSESSGHKGFYVTQTSDVPNAFINWGTGLTNAIE